MDKVNVRLDYFSAHLEASTDDAHGVAEMEKVLKKWGKKRIKSRLLEGVVGGAQYKLDNAKWHDTERAFSATIFKVRDSALPSKVSDEVVEDLGLEDGFGLGEAFTFVYFVNDARLVSQYNHYSGRATRIPFFLRLIGYKAPISFEPLLGQDAMKVLQKQSIVRKLEYTWQPDSATKATLTENAQKIPGIDPSLEIINEFRGLSMSVTVSVGHAQSEKLNKTMVVDFAKKMLGYGPSKLQIIGKEDEDTKSKLIDLINDRVFFYIEMVIKNRQIEHTKSAGHIIRHYQDVKKEL